MTLEDWRNIKIGTKVKYHAGILRGMRYGYYGGVLCDTNYLNVSKITKDDKFSDIRMTDYIVCETIHFEKVQLLEQLI